MRPAGPRRQFLHLGRGKGLPVRRAPPACLGPVPGPAVLAPGPVPGPGAVHGAEELFEQGPQRRQAAGDDAGVELHDAPPGEVHRVPEPVAAGAVRAQVRDAHDGARRREAAEAQDEEEGQLGPPRHVDVPQHGQRDADGEDEVTEDVKAEVDVAEDLDLLARPAGGRCFDR